MSRKRKENQPQDNPEAQDKKGLSRRDFFKKGAVAGVGAAALTGHGNANAQASSAEEVEWHYEADVVVVGSGATGLPAAIRARDLGASVLVVEQNFDVGGRMQHSGGNVNLGGGDAVQLRDLAGENDAEGLVTVEPLEPPEALEDNLDLLFTDHTDWTVVDAAGRPEYRYNDRDQHRGWADNAPPTRDFLAENYVRWARIRGTHSGGGMSRARRSRPVLKLGDRTDIRAGTITREDAGVPGQRSSHFAPRIQGDTRVDAGPDTVGGGGVLARCLEFSAREKGVQFMLNRHLDEIIREEPFSGRVLGIKASYTPRHDPDTGIRLESLMQNGNIDERREWINIRARKAVVIGSGGHAGNAQLRSMFYPAMNDPLYPTSGWALLGEGRA